MYFACGQTSDMFDTLPGWLHIWQVSQPSVYSICRRDGVAMHLVRCWTGNIFDMPQGRLLICQHVGWASCILDMLMGMLLIWDVAGPAGPYTAGSAVFFVLCGQTSARQRIRYTIILIAYIICG